ncbi:adenosylcobinamide-GDP ribazoletransferase [Streptomyces globosus]|uniref:adenosylcobinamide-GDP ribazoletransferase n=1 Tax=Streptomyces globosus TaxID=68209 RepID=UPI003812AAD9
MTDPTTDPAGDPLPPSRPAPPQERAALGHGLRFAFGTLTVLPVRITRWDRPAARTGMACAPLAGLVVGTAAAAAGTAFALLGGGPLLAAAAAVTVPAALTRGLHLDGLADTADGLGSAKPAAEALRIMKRSDIGPFGVVALLLLLLLQAGALADAFAEGWARGALAAATAATAARLAMTLASRGGIPPARPDGLGAAVAGVVPRHTAVLAAAAVAVLAAAAAAPGGALAAVRAAAAVAAALAVAELLLRRCVRRFGGVTGDVFGAVAETAATTALVVLALG